MRLSRLLTLTLSLSVILTCSLVPDAQAGKLKGRVDKGDMLNQQIGGEDTDDSGPSLSRTDIGKSDGQKGFNGNGLQPVLDAPESAFKGADIDVPGNKFGLSADKDGFAGQPLQPAAGGMNPAGQPLSPTLGFPNLANPVVTGMGTPNGFPPSGLMSSQPGANNAFDPDSTREMQLAWDAWHKRIANSIYSRINMYTTTMFKTKQPLAVRVSYVVTRDCRIHSIQVLQRSANPMYNALAVQVIKSLNGNSQLLAFPQGSRRTAVEKFGTFKHNMDREGFRYTTGDRETIRHG